MPRLLRKIGRETPRPIPLPETPFIKRKVGDPVILSDSPCHLCKHLKDIQTYETEERARWYCRTRDYSYWFGAGPYFCSGFDDRG